MKLVLDVDEDGVLGEVDHGHEGRRVDTDSEIKLVPVL